MHTPPPTGAIRAKYEPAARQDLPPTMRVAVELVFVRTCPDCRAIAERTAVAAISDASVTGLKLIPGTKHAHVVVDESGASQHTGKASDAPTSDSAAQNILFDAMPHSDTNGFDSQGRA